MRKRLVCALIALVMALSMAAGAFASNFYIIPDSNTRLLTREALWGWQYDALGYILNEIFARHGYHFIPGEKYDSYFRAQAWYRENTQYQTNQQIYEKLVTAVEWQNERLVKDVRQEMRALGTTNPSGRPLPQVAYEPPIHGAFSSFGVWPFGADQRLAVYSGPGTQYWRGADGKAMASTNGPVYVGGWENGWLMVMYWTNDRNVRVGYAASGDFRDTVDAQMLRYAYAPATLTAASRLTDDPVATYTTMAQLPQGAQVTYLSEYVNEYRWAYIETSVGGQPARGFVPAENVQTGLTAETDDIGNG